jgi:hypothetical protein
MTFSEIVKAIGGVFFIVFIVSGIWLFCTAVADFMMERTPGENKEEK